MSTATLTPQQMTGPTPLRDFLAGLLDDAIGYRWPDGVCMHCVKAVTNRCPDHQRDQDLADAYMGLYRAVEDAGSDEEALAVFVAGLPDGRVS